MNSTSRPHDVIYAFPRAVQRQDAATLSRAPDGALAFISLLLASEKTVFDVKLVRGGEYWGRQPPPKDREKANLVATARHSKPYFPHFPCVSFVRSTAPCH